MSSDDDDDDCRGPSRHTKKHKMEQESTETQTQRRPQAAFTDGLRVVDSGSDLGRIAIATRDFRAGEVVLLEAPALVFDQYSGNGLFDLFDKFVALAEDETTQASILAMHHRAPTSATSATSTASAAAGAQPPQPSDPQQQHQPSAYDREQQQREMAVESELRRYQREQPSSAQHLNIQLAKQLVDIVGCNAHAFSSCTSATSSDMVANGASGRTEVSSALFAVASKVEHSCAPNLNFCTDTGRGMIRYTAEIPIHRGDRLSISYTKGVLQTPREERRAFLQENKHFLCQCVRCLDLDECCPLPCQMCHNKGSKGVAFQSGRRDKSWFCVSSCGWDGECSQQSKEVVDRLAERIDLLRGSLQYGIDGDNTLSMVMTAQAQVAQKVHPLHWLHMAAWDLVSIVASSLARLDMMENDEEEDDDEVSSASGLLRISATCLLHQILWTERSAAIVYGHLELKGAVDEVGRSGAPCSQLKEGQDETREICGLLDLLCDPINKRRCKPPHGCTHVTHMVYHAGQDLLWAGHPVLACRLYKHYEAMLQASHGKISDVNKENLRILVESGGTDNCFQNHLLTLP